LKALNLGPEKLYVREGAPVSFFTSPFYAHTRFCAIDIGSPPSSERIFVSPVRGTVVQTEKFLINRPAGRGIDPYDYFLLIETRKFKVKMLHVKPTVSVGDSVKVGDMLGNYVRSPYLAPYHFDHAHIEIHAKHSRMNPTSAKPLRFCAKLIGPKREDLEGNLVYIGKEYILLEASHYSMCDEMTGIPGRVDGEPIILNVEIPHMCYGGLIGERIRLGTVRLCGVVLGRCVRRRGGMGLFERRPGALKNWLQFDQEILMNRSLPCNGLRIECEGSRYKLLEITLRVGAPPFLKLVGGSMSGHDQYRIGDRLAVRLLANEVSQTPPR